MAAFAEQYRIKTLWCFGYFIVYLWRGVHISLENSCATRQLASHTLYFIFVCSPLFVRISLQICVHFLLLFICSIVKTSKRHGMHPIITTKTMDLKKDRANTYKTFVCLFWSFLQVVTIGNVWMESKLSYSDNAATEFGFVFFFWMNEHNDNFKVKLTVFFFRSDCKNK